MGGVPYWFELLRAAELLGVPPWELEHVPAEWIHRALAVDQARYDARKNLNRKGA
jgi:hypothetical protein